MSSTLVTARSLVGKTTSFVAGSPRPVTQGAKSRACQGVINKYYTTRAFHGRPPLAHPLHIGTLSHELGHLLGMGDLYDTSTSTSGAGNLIGNYDLMV